jgi:hypothetical protein
MGLATARADGLGSGRAKTIGGRQRVCTEPIFVVNLESPLESPAMAFDRETSVNYEESAFSIPFNR